MNTKKIAGIFWSIAALVFLIVSARIPSAAQSPAEIQLAVAAPDPVKAGEELTFQVIMLNKETAAWNKADVNCVIELFDSSGKYIGKTGGFKLPSDVPQGASALILATHRLPFSYSGRYQFRVMLYKKGQNILTSDYYDFSVKAAAVEKKKHKPVFLNGSMSFLFKDSERADYQSSVSANLLGKLYSRTLIFNSNAYSSEDDRFDIDSIFLSLFAKKYKISAGDIMPEFSPLSLYSLTGRGLAVDYAARCGDFSVCYVQTQDSSEGDASSNGVYARYTGGLNASVKLPSGFGLKLSGVQTSDSESSISSPGPANSAIANNVLSSEMRWSCGFMDVKGEYASSSRKEKEYVLAANTYDSGLSTAGAAYRFETRVFTRKFNLKGKYQQAEADFLNLASPGLYPDREITELSGGYVPFRFLRIDGGVQSSEDNLDNDVSVVTTKQTVSNYGFQLNVKNFPGINVSSTLNKVEGSSVTVLNNETKGMNIGVNYRRGNQMFSAGFSNSAFRNYASTATGQDLDTGVLSFTYSGAVGSFLSFDAGYTTNETENLYDKSIDETVSVSLGANVKFTKKVNMFLYGSKTSREKLADNVETVMQNYSAEITYSTLKNLSVTSGFSIEKNDETTDANDYSSNGYLFRLHYSF
ncbi:MAG: hypothetical protein U9O97_02315 [Elusimicrobiota bacterium]|nr:hypothetical protein [Elusimicrobiota bacterium]